MKAISKYRFFFPLPQSSWYTRLQYPISFVDDTVCSWGRQLQCNGRILSCVSSVFLNHYQNLCFLHFSPWYDKLTGAVIVIIIIINVIITTTDVLLKIFGLTALFSDPLHFHCTIAVHLYQLAVNIHDGNLYYLQNWTTLWTYSRDQFPCRSIAR